MPAPTPAVPLSAFAWFFPSVIGLPLNGGTGSASAIVPRTRLFAEQHFVAAASPSCSGLRVCLPPGSLLRSEEHTSELQSRLHLVCRLLLEKKKKNKTITEIAIYSNA